jgi:flagellar biosynthesis protein FliQ
VIGHVSRTGVYYDSHEHLAIGSHHVSYITHHEARMTPEMVTEIGRQAIETTLIVSTPILGLALVVGLAVSVLQAMTQLNEATLTFVPKVVAVFAVILVFLPWMLGVLTSFMTQLFLNIPNYAQ